MPVLNGQASQPIRQAGLLCRQASSGKERNNPEGSGLGCIASLEILLMNIRPAWQSLASDFSINDQDDQGLTAMLPSSYAAIHQ